MSSDDDKPLTASAFTPAGGGDAPLRPQTFEPPTGRVGRRRRVSVATIGLAAAAAVAVLVLGFLLSARSLEIVVATESEAVVRIDGFALPLGSRWLLRPGDYGIAVSAEGYAPYTATFTVTDADSQRLDIAPAILPGVVSISTAPPGAEILLDGETLGISPLDNLRIDAGAHRLELRLPRYQPDARDIDITGRGVSQTFSLSLAPDWARVALATEPVGARVSIDDEPAVVADGGIEVLSGQHTLLVSAPGFREARRELRIDAGVDQDLGTIALVPANGVLELSSNPSSANVTVDGEFVGRTPVTIELSPGSAHLVQLAKAGYKRRSQQIAIDQGQTETRTITLDPELGEVAFTLAPADAELVINGKRVGSGSQTLSLPAFEHRVEVRLPGYAPFRTRVLPRPGLRQAVDVALLTESEARKAALTPEITTALGQTLILIDPVAEPLNEFSMGASRREPGRRSNEVEHSVRLERAFYLATTETSNAQFRQFSESHDSGQIEGNSLNREHQPVVNVSWQQAASFCNWLSRKEGLEPFYRETQGIISGYNPSSNGYRLPTEAEWSFAARVAGEGYRRFAWGEEFPPTQAVTNVADNTSAFVTGRILNGYADGHIVSAPVGSFPPNHRGLHDMGGNVAEWVHDVYRIPSANAEVEVDPLGSQSGDNYTVRGASWALSRLSELRLTARDYGQAGRDDLGFRIARYAE